MSKCLDCPDDVVRTPYGRYPKRCIECKRLHENARVGAYIARRYAENAEFRQRVSDYNKARRDRNRELDRARYANDPRVAEQKKAAALRWAKTPAGKASLSNTRHRRRSIQNAGDITSAEIREMRERTKSCPLCKVRLTVGQGPRQKQLDHIMPLAAGGTHDRTNVRIICRTCNLTRPNDGSDIFDTRPEGRRVCEDVLSTH